VRKLAAAAVVVLTLVAPGSARAQSAQDKAAADVLFREAKRLMQEGKLAEACPKFAESNRLDAGIGTMLWLADCYDRTGKTASAWGQFQEAAEIAARSKDGREKVARARAASLEPKLIKLVIVVPPASEVPSLDVKRDGTILGKPLWGTAVPVDPGTHAVTASAPGYKSWDSSVDAAGEGKTVKVTVPKLDVEEHPVVDNGTPPVKPVEPEPKERGGVQRLIGLGVAGLGVVGVGLGVVFGLSAKSKLDDSNADGHCRPDNHCDAVGFQARSDAKDAATLSTIFVVAGAALLGGGAVLYFTAPRGKPRSGTVQLLPTFGHSGASLHAVATF
jgi:serine/threonine-protein kinase